MFESAWNVTEPLVPGITDVAQYSWFIGMGLALVRYRVLAPRFPVTMASLQKRASTT